MAEKPIKEYKYGELMELPSFTWIITAGTHAWVYSGSKEGFSEALSRVRKDKWSQGSTVRSTLVVK